MNGSRYGRGIWAGVQVRVSSWAAPALLLLLTRLASHIVALTAVRLFPLSETMYTQDPVMMNPYTLPGLWIRYDAGYYLGIAVHGYSRGGPDVNFMPLYPLLTRLFSGGGGDVAAAWAGLALSNLAFMAAGLLLWEALRAHSAQHRAATAGLLSLVLFPTAFFFSAIYTESLFLLLAVLVARFTRQQRYLAAAFCVALASITRVTGGLLALIPLVDLLTRSGWSAWKKLFSVGLLSGAGLAGWMAYQWATQGSPLAFVQTQSATMGRSIAAPWTTLIDSARVVLTASENWFMRVVTLQDLSLLLLFVALGLLAWRWLPRGLAVYLLATALFLMLSHGPHQYGVFSMSRYVLNLFPGFLVLGLLLERLGRWKYLYWTVSAALQVFLTGWWVTGHWVA